MKQLIIAATVAVIGLCYMPSLQAQTSTHTTKSATKSKTIKNSAAQPKPDAKHCDVVGGATHKAASY
jgi:hypothetical protein